MELNKGFITFEGPEGCGKSTQVALLVAYLKRTGFDVLQTREPGSGPVGVAIRQILLQSTKLTDLTEVMLFQADRAQHVQTVIKPHLEKCGLVVCDRFGDSSVAYQGYGRGLGRELITYLNDISTQGLKPATTILLDLSPEEGLRRVHARNDLDRIEKEELSFHRRLRAGFLAEARLDPDRFVVIDAAREIEEIAIEIRSAVMIRLVL